MSNSLVRMLGTLTWSDIVYTGTGLPRTGDVHRTKWIAEWQRIVIDHVGFSMFKLGLTRSREDSHGAGWSILSIYDKQTVIIKLNNHS